MYIYATSSGVYATDGTAAGTTLLQAAGADFVPQPGTQMVTLPNGKVLFFALVNPSLDLIGALVSGIRIWETDGTTAGTTLVAETVAPDGLQVPGDTISSVEAIGNNVSFAFNEPGAGSQPFVTNGTTAATNVVTNAAIATTGLPSTSAVVGGGFTPKLIFATSAGVYSTDGTDAGTTLLQAAGVDFVPQSGTQMVTLPNGKVLFFALVNPSLDVLGAIVGGIRVWETDGTTAGTTLVAEIPAPDALQTPGDTISNVEAIGNNISFTFNVPGGGSQPYVTNGSTAGTAIVTNPAVPSTGLPSTSAVVGGPFTPKLIFATSAGVYSTDGTDAGTTLLQAAGADFVPLPGTQMVTLPNGKVVFTALVDPSLDIIGALTSGIRIWETDGTTAGTALVAETTAPDSLQVPGDTISNVEAIGNDVSFAFNVPGSGSQLYVTNGTQSGTSAVSSALLPSTGLTMGADTLCFLRGTLIRTPAGEASVETLAAGDLVVTLSGGARPILWIGTGRAQVTPGRRRASTPVVVRKGALGDNVPYRDLRVTKGHSLFLDDVLIPAEFLVNHRSIAWDDLARKVEVYHIELESHDILMANGAPAESYRDDGNRWLFENANDGWDQPAKPSCAPVLTGGPVVDAVWQRLLLRAGPRPNVKLTGDPDLHLLADGERNDGRPERDGWHMFRLPKPPQSVRIVSRAAAPAELGLSRDPRSLGVAVRQVRVQQGRRLHVIRAEDPELNDGFHGYEPELAWRWTDGDAGLPPALWDAFTGPLEVLMRLGGSARYVEGRAPN